MEYLFSRWEGLEGERVVTPPVPGLSEIQLSEALTRITTQPATTKPYHLSILLLSTTTTITTATATTNTTTTTTTTVLLLLYHHHHDPRGYKGNDATGAMDTWEPPTLL